ncbi:MAG: DUF2752 domain-containing protein [Myxococcota bacterium]
MLRLTSSKRALPLGLLAVTLALACTTIAVVFARLGWSEGCAVLRTTGWPCPGCGATRAMVHLLHLQPVHAWRMHPLVTGLAMTSFGWAIADLALWRHGLRLAPRRSVGWAVLLPVAVGLNWLYSIGRASL